MKRLVLSLIVVLSACSGVNVEKRVRSQVVMLEGAHGQCTGEQVKSPSGRNFILTAAHCAPLIVDGHIMANVDGKRPIPRKVLEVSPVTDLMLVEGMPKLEGMQVSGASSMKGRYTAYTHGDGKATHKGEGEALAEEEVKIMDHLIDGPESEAACNLPKNKVESALMGFVKGCFIVVVEQGTTIPVEPGSSGGPVVDSNGDLVGVVSAADSHFSYLITLKDIHNFLTPY